MQLGKIQLAFSKLLRPSVGRSGSERQRHHGLHLFLLFLGAHLPGLQGGGEEPGWGERLEKGCLMLQAWEGCRSHCWEKTQEPLGKDNKCCHP